MKRKVFVASVLTVTILASTAGISVAQPLLPSTTATTTKEKPELKGIQRDDALSAALSSASAKQAKVSVIKISGNEKSSYASTSSEGYVNPAFNTLLLTVGLIKAEGSNGTVKLGDSNKERDVESVVEGVVEGAIPASDLLSGNYLQQSINSARRVGLDNTNSDMATYSPMYMARVLQEIKRSDDASNTNAIASQGLARLIVNSLRKGGEQSVLHNKVGKGNKVAALSVKKDGFVHEVGYIFNKTDLFSYSLMAPLNSDVDIPGAIGRVMEDALRGRINSEPKEKGSRPEGLKGATRINSNVESDSMKPEPGQSAFE